MSKITKKDIVENVKNTLATTNQSANEAVNAMLEVIVEGLKEGNQISIRELGVFEVVVKPERKGYNLNTKESMIIPESKSVRFKASKSLKDKIK